MVLCNAAPIHHSHVGISLSYICRVTRNLTEQISKRFPEDSRRDFKKNPGHVCIPSACYIMYQLSGRDANP